MTIKRKTIKRNTCLKASIIMLAVCFMLIGLPAAAYAEADNKSDNEVYDYTIDTEKDSVGASAAISSGGWSSLGSELSYMEFPEGMTTSDGEPGLWCYCIDISTDTKDGHKYSIETLDAAEYYEPEAGSKIRSILLNSYPNLSISRLEELYQLSGLTEEEAFMATQWIIWYYSNPDGQVDAGGGNYYPADIYKPSEYPRVDITVYYDDDQGNEVRTKSSNIVALAKALDQLAPADPYETELAEIIIEKTEDGDKVVFDYSKTRGLSSLKDLEISVRDGSGNGVPFTHKGHSIIVQRADVSESGDTAQLTVELKAVQDLAKDVYFFSPQGGREASQSRVAAYEGTAPAAASASFSLAAYDPGEDPTKPALDQQDPIKPTPDQQDPIKPTPDQQDPTQPAPGPAALTHDNIPATGDPTRTLPFILASLISLAGMILIIATGRNRKRI